MKNGLDLTLYLVTDRPSTGLSFEQLLDKVDQACRGGVGLVQLREKECTAQEYISMAKRMMEITHKYKVPLVVDDRVDIAFAAGADGVHVGLDDISVADARRLLGGDKIVGATAKTVERAVQAEREGADYLGTGAIFPPTVKVKTQRTSIEKLGEIAGSVNIPTVAISGINRGNLAQLAGTPIAGIAVIAAILDAEDSELETKLLRNDVVEKLLNHSGK
ncbi:MAG: thiamine phosphate synthase [Oscillospiraceae bacterium]|jgi:thiamine-phosphate pyrophosphorylase|nr:thiamine phosphate synthase [Oscillospiraceae bacterium]